MLLPDFDFETSLAPLGTRYLLGIDEVGRGPWAGPLLVAGFLLDLNTFDPSKFQTQCVRDSKSLNPHQRQKISQFLTQTGFKYQVFTATHADIDQKGLKVCLSALLNDCLNFFTPYYDHAIIDGNYKYLLSHPYTSVIKGDGKCFSIAAASIIAKAARDQIMDQYHHQFPQYGFNSHQGYGTALHRQALSLHGLSPIHRRSFAPCRNFLNHTPSPLSPRQTPALT